MEDNQYITTKQARYGRSNGNARIGQLLLSDKHSTIETPTLFPVVNFVTGTTARGGGIWKYILHADTDNGLLRRNLPVLSQVLHFLDFQSTNPQALQVWRQQSIPVRYNEEIHPLLNYSGPIFLDSGGFKLLWNDNLNLDNYGLAIKNGNGAQTILDLQTDFGGDIVASLDYPLPPRLNRSEALERMKKSRVNALKAASLINQRSDKKPFLFVAAHGQDKQTIGRYIQLVFQQFNQNGLSDFNFGIAIGSLVPLRGSHKYQTIIEILQGVIENIPPAFRALVPIHVFGISGNLVPILAYLGIDTYDSSTYVQEARSLKYMDPRTGRSQAILEMEDWVCECRVCQQTSLTDIQDALTSPIRYKPLPNGHYKSKYYGDIALHNLELDFAIVKATQAAIKADSLQEYMIRHVAKFPQLHPCLDIISMTDKTLKFKMNRTVVPVNNKQNLPYNFPVERTESNISLKYQPYDFDILKNEYTGPPSSAQVLLIVPCSKGKPYSHSRTHKFITHALEQAFGEKTSLIHKVVLSGLYGPVPLECELEEMVTGYDFQLQHYDQKQTKLLVDRVSNFIERYRDNYRLCLGYATSRAYREVLEQVSKTQPNLMVLPKKPKSRRLSEFFRHKHITELIDIINHLFQSLNLSSSREEKIKNELDTG